MNLARSIQEKEIETDIVIVGGGPAGCMAAIEAKERNSSIDVVLLEKSHIRRSGSAGMGMDALNNVVIPGVSTPEEYVEAMTIWLEKILDQNLCYTLAKESFAVLKRLEEWGVEFPKDENGNYIVNQFHPKGRFTVEMRGLDFKPILAREVLKRNVKVLNRTMATSILTVDGQAAGVTGLNVRTGEFYVIRAKAVILAAGSAARFGLPNTGYLHGTFDCPYCAGDGYSMAYRAGAELTGMEYVHCAPMLKDYDGPGVSTYIRHGAYLVNALGERFMKKYAPDLMERAPMGIRMFAIWKEIQEGRGPVYFDLRHLPKETIDMIEEALTTVERPTEGKFWQQRGFDLHRDRLVEVQLGAINLCGGHGASGVVINEKAETTVKGLYAAGDVVANPIGFLTAALVFGAIAGRNAAEHAAQTSMPDIDKNQVADEKSRVYSPLLRKEGLKPSVVEYKIRRIVNEYIVSPKSEKKLQVALWWIERLKKDLELLKADDYHELMKALEVHAILDCAEMCARASLERKESRWGLHHYRVDYPERDDKNWLKFVIIKKDPQTGKMKVETRPVELKWKFK